MYSLKELYRIGKGPSSSHTIGPERACKLFLSENPKADKFVVRLYGSLAKTGEGHGTGKVIESVLPNVTVEYDEIMDAVSDFDMVNAKLAAILDKLKVEEF